MKLTERRCWNSRLCSMIVQRTKICSMQDRPLRKPCSSRNCSSTACLNLRSRMEQRTFPSTERVMPSQLLQSDKLPFLGRKAITPFCKSSGTFASTQQVLTRSVSACISSQPPFFSISAAISSMPVAFPFLSVLYILFAQIRPVGRYLVKSGFPCLSFMGALWSPFSPDRSRTMRNRVFESFLSAAFWASSPRC